MASVWFSMTETLPSPHFMAFFTQRLLVSWPGKILMKVLRGMRALLTQMSITTFSWPRA